MNFCNKLALQVVLKQISEELGKKNVVTSPLSLNAVLNMVAVGSKGRTLEQLLEALEAKSIEELNLKSSEIMALALPDLNNGACFGEGGGGGPLLSIVNGVWADLRCPLKPSFEEVVKKYYKADTQTVDFVNKAQQVVEEVNLWIENGTKGLIKKLLSSIPSNTMIILANALYFKGAWKNAFDKSRTLDEDFHLLSGEKIKVPFMTSKTNEYHLYGSFEGFKLLKLPYRSGGDHHEETFENSFKTSNLKLFGDNMSNEQHGFSSFDDVKGCKLSNLYADDHDEGRQKFSMYVFLPDERNGLENLLKKLKSEPLLLQQHCDEMLREVELAKMWLPKFKFSYGFKPSDTMKELGINLPFMSVGELTEMVDSPDSDTIFISDIIQKACVEVNEEGTEAAAVTIVFLCGQSLMHSPPPPPSFVADHPFLFMIKEEVSGVVFFTGAVVNPLLA